MRTLGFVFAAAIALSAGGLSTGVLTACAHGGTSRSDCDRVVNECMQRCGSSAPRIPTRDEKLQRDGMSPCESRCMASCGGETTNKSEMPPDGGWRPTQEGQQTSPASP